MKLKKLNNNGSAGAKVLGVVAVILVGAILFQSGYISVGLPIDDSEYEDLVIRKPTDVGMTVPIEIVLTFDQSHDPSKSNHANINLHVKHKHSTGSNKVPDAQTVSNLQYNLNVGSKIDNTKFAVNGNGFTAGETGFDIPEIL